MCWGEVEECCGPPGSRIVSRLWASSGVTRRGWPFAPGIFHRRRNPLSQQVSRGREARKKRRLQAAPSSPGDGKRLWRSVAASRTARHRVASLRLCVLSPEDRRGRRSRHLLRRRAGLPAKELLLMDGDAFLRWRVINQLCSPGFPGRTEAGEAELGRALAPGFVGLLLPVLPPVARSSRSPRCRVLLACDRRGLRTGWRVRGLKLGGGGGRGARGEDAGRKKHGLPCVPAAAAAGRVGEGRWEQAGGSQRRFPGHMVGGL